MGEQCGQRYVAKALIGQAPRGVVRFFLCLCVLNKIEKHGDSPPQTRQMEKTLNREGATVAKELFKNLK
jgi:hypothetical protein